MVNCYWIRAEKTLGQSVLADGCLNNTFHFEFFNYSLQLRNMFLI